MNVRMDNEKRQKKPTKGDMERKIKSAVLFVPKDRDTQSVYFDDKGLRLTVTDDYCIVATGAHQHVFNNVNVAGVSRPWLYTKRFVEIALGNDCIVKDEKGNPTRSYSKLFELLKGKEDKSEYNICWFVDLWLNNIFAPLYEIDETESSAFLVYERYLHNIARQQVVLEEKTDDMTNLQFVDKVIDNEKKYLDGIQENVIFKKRTDEEKVQDEIDAIQEIFTDEQTTKNVENNG